MYYIICIRSAFAGFSWLFGVRGDFCMPDVENTVRKEDQIILQGGGDPPGGPSAPPESQDGGTEGGTR